MAQTLLLADESVTIQRVVELMLAGHGIKVVSVSDGQQAVDYLTGQRPDIMLFSVSLQKLDGFEVTAIARARPSLRDVPILLVAGAFDTIDDARVRESGAAGVLIKPFEPRQVINRVKELLGLSAKSADQVKADDLSASGRLITSSGPVSRDEAAAADPADPSGARRTTSPTQGESSQSWNRLRETSGLGADAPAVEGQDAGGDDYFEQLDAAFDTLDAQLAGRQSVGGRAPSPPPPPRYPAALDPGGRRPVPPDADADLRPASTPAPLTAMPVTDSTPPESPKPVFEVDEHWFSAAGTADAASRDVPQDAPAESSSEAVPLPGAESPVPIASSTPEPPAPTAPGPRAAPELSAAPARYIAPDVTTAVPIAPGYNVRAHSGNYAVQPPAMADAFAVMLAEEQGEAVPMPVAQSRPVELSDDVVDRIAQRVVERLLHGTLGDNLTKTVNEVSERLVREEIARIRASAAEKSS